MSSHLTEVWHGAGGTTLPEDWHLVPFGELLADERGLSVGVMYPGNHDPNGIPLIKIGDVSGGTITSPGFRIAPAVHHEYRRTALEGGELIISLVGRPGLCLEVPASMAGWNVARALAVVRLQGLVDRRYARHTINSPPVQRVIDGLCNTTVQATLNLKELRTLPIPLPPLAEQRRIAVVLGALDDKIELNRKMNRTLEEMAHALFRSWFIDFDGHADLVESELGPIPRDWTVGTPDMLVEFDPRAPLSKGTPITFVEMKALSTTSFSIESTERREFTGGSKFKQHDTLLARITPCLENGKTAYVDVLEDGEVGAGSTEFIVMRGKSGVPSEWVYTLARSEEFRAHAIANMTGSSGRQRVPANCFQHMRLALPPHSLLARFGEIASPLFRRMNANVKESRTLAALRDLLLPKLISGEFRVPEALDLLESSP